MILQYKLFLWNATTLQALSRTPYNHTRTCKSHTPKDVGLAYLNTNHIETC